MGHATADKYSRVTLGCMVMGQAAGHDHAWAPWEVGHNLDTRGNGARHGWWVQLCHPRLHGGGHDVAGFREGFLCGFGWWRVDRRWWMAMGSSISLNWKAVVTPCAVVRVSPLAGAVEEVFLWSSAAMNKWWQSRGIITILPLFAINSPFLRSTAQNNYNGQYISSTITRSIRCFLVLWYLVDFLHALAKLI